MHDMSQLFGCAKISTYDECLVLSVCFLNFNECYRVVGSENTKFANKYHIEVKR